MKAGSQAQVSVCALLDDVGHWLNECDVSQVTLLDLD